MISSVEPEALRSATLGQRAGCLHAMEVISLRDSSQHFSSHTIGTAEFDRGCQIQVYPITKSQARHFPEVIVIQPFLGFICCCTIFQFTKLIHWSRDDILHSVSHDNILKPSISSSSTMSIKPAVGLDVFRTMHEC